jgi:hypothetical protein
MPCPWGHCSPEQIIMPRHRLEVAKRERHAQQSAVMLKKSVGATPLNSCGFAVYSVECMRRRWQPQEPP